MGCYVKDGKYRIDRVPGGVRRVTIEGPRSVVKYADVDRSGLLVDVGEGINEFNFELGSE